MNIKPDPQFNIIKPDPQHQPNMSSDSSSSTSTFIQPNTHIPIKLTKDNYLLWRSLFVSVLKASDMLDLAEGRELCPPQGENPAYTNWIRKDQSLLTWINSSLSVNLLIYTAEITSGRALWLHLENQLAENSRTRVLELKDRLRNLDMVKPHSMTLEKYLKTAKEIADGLEAQGSPVDDSEYVSCVLNGLPMLYDDGFVTSIRNRPVPVTRKQLHKLLLRYHPKSTLVFFLLLFVCFPLSVLSVGFGISFIFPLLVFACLITCGNWDSRLSSTTRNSARSTQMKPHTE